MPQKHNNLFRKLEHKKLDLIDTIEIEIMFIIVILAIGTILLSFIEGWSRFDASISVGYHFHR